VDSSAIFLDYAGLRTFDSMVRLKKIFGQDTVTVISQQFHNERAIFIGAREGITAIGFNAKDVRSGDYNKREILARVKVFIDFLTGNEPKYLGPEVHIPE
jgi:SanA protein